MFPEERLYSADLGTVGTQSLPREAVGSSPQYLPVGPQLSLAHPRRVIQGGRTWLPVPAGRGHLQHGVAAPWVVLWVANVLSPGQQAGSTFSDGKQHHSLPWGLSGGFSSPLFRISVVCSLHGRMTSQDLGSLTPQTVILLQSDTL